MKKENNKIIIGAKQLRIAKEIFNERIFQDERWGIQRHLPDHWMIILGEEFGEACAAALEEDYNEYRKELIQVAAVAFAAIESYDDIMNGVSIDHQGNVETG